MTNSRNNSLTKALVTIKNTLSPPSKQSQSFVIQPQSPTIIDTPISLETENNYDEENKQIINFLADAPQPLSSLNKKYPDSPITSWVSSLNLIEIPSCQLDYMKNKEFVIKFTIINHNHSNFVTNISQFLTALRPNLIKKSLGAKLITDEIIFISKDNIPKIHLKVMIGLSDHMEIGKIIEATTKSYMIALPYDMSKYYNALGINQNNEFLTARYSKDTTIVESCAKKLLNLTKKELNSYNIELMDRQIIKEKSRKSTKDCCVIL